MSLLCGSNVNYCGSRGGGGVKDDHWFLITRQPDPSPRWILWFGFVNPAVLTNQKTISLPPPPPPPPPLVFLGFAYVRTLLESLPLPREYCMIYRGPGFLAVVWGGSSITHLTPLSRQQLFSLSQSSYVSPLKLTDGRGVRGGVFEEPNHTTAEKSGPSIIHSLLSLSTPPCNPGTLLRQNSD
jgi:hypothetical protein